MADQAQEARQMSELLDQRRARCDPPTIERLAEELEVAPKTIYLWRKGEKIGKVGRVLLRLLREQAA